jgi:hypothetical protein
VRTARGANQSSSEFVSGDKRNLHQEGAGLLSFNPKNLGLQLANTWPKITARDGYASVRNVKEPENLHFSSVAATVEKASTYVFAGRLIRNAEVRGSTPLCSTI